MKILRGDNTFIWKRKIDFSYLEPYNEYVMKEACKLLEKQI